jgi:hypothetical protein
VNGILEPSTDAFHQPPDPPARLGQIAFARQRPPREPGAETGKHRPRDRALSQPLNSQCAAADADEPSRHREAFASPVPPATFPHADRRTMSCQV